jgi:hypothetical protein
MGKVAAVYGTHDHVILIFGRIADYSAKDRMRKFRATEGTSKSWRPDPELMRAFMRATQQSPPTANGVGPPGTFTPSTASSPSSKGGSTPPPFFGMAPVSGDREAPDAYTKNATTPPYEYAESSNYGDDDITTKTLEALAEWESIYSALTELGTRFGPNFSPLADDLTPNIDSPYGKPLNYPSQDIAVIWALYYAAHIVLFRSHPVMPPFSLVASGFATAYTEKFAMMIGRIAAGLMQQPLCHPLSPSMGASLCEVTVPCFVAGVQFMDDAQRHWLVEKTSILEELTGWASIGMIGHGCELAWERMAELGKGPPYVKQVPSSSYASMDSRFTHQPQQQGGPATQTPRQQFDVQNRHMAPSAEQENTEQRVPRMPPNEEEIEQFFQGGDVKSQAKRVHYAMGVLGEEGDKSAAMMRDESTPAERRYEGRWAYSKNILLPYSAPE